MRHSFWRQILPRLWTSFLHLPPALEYSRQLPNVYVRLCVYVCACACIRMYSCRYEESKCLLLNQSVCFWIKAFAFESKRLLLHAISGGKSFGCDFFDYFAVGVWQYWICVSRLLSTFGIVLQSSCDTSVLIVMCMTDVCSSFADVMWQSWTYVWRVLWKFLLVWGMCEKRFVLVSLTFVIDVCDWRLWLTFVIDVCDWRLYYSWRL